MNDGWIKLSRKLLDWEWHDEPGTLSLFIHLLLMATRKDTRWKGVELKRGQLVTTLAKLESITGLTERMTRDRLLRLEESGSIVRQTSNKYTTITICNYDEYQSIDDEEGQTKVTQTSNKGQTKVTPIYNKNIRIIYYDYSNGRVCARSDDGVEVELDGLWIERIQMNVQNKTQRLLNVVEVKEYFESFKIQQAARYEEENYGEFRRHFAEYIRKRVETEINDKRNAAGRNNNTAESRYQEAADLISELIADGEKHKG